MSDTKLTILDAPREYSSEQASAWSAGVRAGQALAAQPAKPEPQPVIAPVKPESETSGWVLAPLEPTNAMRVAGRQTIKGAADEFEGEQAVLAYKQMLAVGALPAQPVIAPVQPAVPPDTAPMYKALLRAREALSVVQSGASINAIALIDDVLNAVPTPQQIIAPALPKD